jgi:dihydropteroate synthase
MHRQGEPATMQQAPAYQDVVSEVCSWLRSRVEASLSAGIGRNQLLVDPGFGFGKTLEHNLQLLDGLAALQALELPVLIGLSRKRMLGALIGRVDKDRVNAGVAAAVIAVMKGARIVRTHDVDATVDAIKVCRALHGIS